MKNIQKQIEETEKKLTELKKKLKKETEKQGYIEIPELKIKVEKNVHNKNKGGWNELGLSNREDELLTAEECIWLANSKYAETLKMDGSSSDDNFFIKQPFKVNKKNGAVAGFGADSDGAYLSCYGDAGISLPSLGVRFVVRKK